MATLTTSAAVAAGLGGGALGSGDATAAAPQASSLRLAAAVGSREVPLSRASVRTARSVSLAPRVTRHRFATANLNVWTGPGERFRKVGLVDSGTKLGLTGQVRGHWAEVILAKGAVRWVNADYLSRTKPKPPAAPAASAASTSAATTTGGLSTAPCPDGSSIESGLTSSAVALYRAACAAFPALSTYGGRDPHGEHVDGRAIDFMISDPALGNAVAEWARANAASLNLRDIIWSQRIWTRQRAAEGWRGMSDRGSATANHYTHVHIAVF